MIEFSLTLPRFRDPDDTVPYRQAFEFCQTVDQLGYAGGFIGHHSFSPEVKDEAAPFVYLAAVGAHTERMRLGTGVYLAALHHPANIIEQVSTLDRITNGRAVLGVGTGYRPYEFETYGTPYHERGRVLDEVLDVCRTAWTTGSYAWDGNYFHFDDVPGGTMKVTAAVRGQPSANDEQTVELAEGQRVDGVTLRLELGTPITGVVLTPDRSPATGVLVQVAGGPDAPRIRARSGADGRFELLGVTEAMGAVELFTIVASYNWYHPNARVGASAPTAAFAGDTEVVLELRPLTTLAGRVEDASGAPLEGVKVRAYLAGTERTRVSSLGSAKTGPDGSFGLQLPDDCSVDLIADPPPTPSADEEGSAESKPLPAAILEGIPSNAGAAVLRFEP